MSKVAEDAVSFVDPEDTIDLWHYASKYYDPAKAKAYYERTKELKGREKGKSEPLSKESRERQSQATTYVRKQIGTAKTAAQEKLAKEQKARLEKLQKTAQETRDRIVAKLDALMEKLAADIDVEVPKPKLNEIPATASPRQRAFLEKQNAKLMANYNGKRRKASEKASASAREAKDKARGEIQKVGQGLKDAVTKARDNYKKGREAIVTKYKTELKTELQNIEDKVR